MREVLFFFVRVCVNFIAPFNDCRPSAIITLFLTYSPYFTATIIPGQSSRDPSFFQVSGFIHADELKRSAVSRRRYM